MGIKNIALMLIITLIIVFCVGKCNGLKCYNCGYRIEDDYCSLKSQWISKDCVSATQLNGNEVLACVKTTFTEQRSKREGYFQSTQYISTKREKIL